MLWLHAYSHKEKNGYPSRFFNAAQVRPVSSGRTIANVRNEIMQEANQHILPNDVGFYPGERCPGFS
jgi:hypothetical protein